MSDQYHIPDFVSGAKLLKNHKVFGDAGCYFDGTTGYIYAATSTEFDIYDTNAADATVDFWFKFGTSNVATFVVHREDSNNYWLIGHEAVAGYVWRVRDLGVIPARIDSNVVETDENWHHVALVKNGNDTGLYVDGVQIGYDTLATDHDNSGPLNIGSFDGTVNMHDGYMDEVRITRTNSFSGSPNVGLTDTIAVPISPHTADSNTKLLLSFDGNLTDESATGHTMTATAPAGAAARFGDAYAFNGTSDYLVVPYSPDFDVFGSNSDSWTVDLWVNVQDVASTNNMIYTQREDANNRISFRIMTDGTVDFDVRSGGVQVIDILQAGVITDNTWQHIALCKVADEYAIYVDGTQVNYVQDTSTATNTGDLHIGEDNTGQYFEGRMDEFRIQNSNYFGAAPVVGLTDTIIVPTQAYGLPFARSQAVVVG